MRVVALVAVALLAAAVHAPVSAAAARPDRCFAAKGRTVALNTQARLFTRGTGASGVLYGCRRARKPERLARNHDDGYVESGHFSKPTVAGPYAAFGYSDTDVSCKAACPPDYDATIESLIVVDVRTMKSAYVTGYGGGDWVLTATGAVAWMTGAAGSERIVMARHRGETRELARGNGIDDASLQASRSRVTWLQDGRVAGAALG